VGLIYNELMSSINSIDLHLRTYRSALKSNLEIALHSLTSSYLKINSILHPFAADPTHLDPSALIYSLLRLPRDIDRSKTVILGQNPEVFLNRGFPDVTKWKKSAATARRRTCYFDLKTGLLASFISSISDIDDVINLLLAYQIEWNKFHQIATSAYPKYSEFKAAFIDNEHPDEGLKLLQISPTDWQNIKTALGKNWRLRLKRIYHYSQNLRVRLLASSWIDYTKTTQLWWKNTATSSLPKFDLSHQKIYFVSSNPHSLLNLITGFALSSEKTLLKFSPRDYSELAPYIHKNDYLYYLSKFFKNDKKYQSDWQKLQNRLNILTLSSPSYLNLTTQIFPVSSFARHSFSGGVDPRLKISRPSKIANSNALIFNIDYPLGFTAYHILSEILENVSSLGGVYILGKAAVLNSEIGDLQIPRLTFDEHTQNSYVYKNCFNTFFPYTNTQGSILTQQKSVTVLGTFLENEALLKKYSENNLTIIEMETGPYLSAITEATHDLQTPRNTMVDLNSAPFDIGIINYTSDTPYSKAKNLAAGSLNLAGVEPVYLGSLAILQRIINLEEQY